MIFVLKQYLLIKPYLQKNGEKMVDVGMNSCCQMVFQRNVILIAIFLVALNGVIVELLRDIAIALNALIIEKV